MMLGWRLQCREPMCASLHVCALHPECGLSVWGNSGPCCAIGRGLTLGAGARLVASGYQLHRFTPRREGKAGSVAGRGDFPRLVRILGV